VKLINENNYDLTLPGIYCIKNTVNEKVYIGSAKVLRNRIWEHRSDLKRKRHKNIHLTRAYEQYGVEAFEIFILEVIENLDKLKEREQYWMDTYRSHDKEKGYNISKLAERSTMSEDGKKRLSELRKGRPLSEAHKKAISEGGKGRKFTEEHRKRIGDAHRGRARSDEVKKILSEAKKKSTYRPDTEKLRLANIGRIHSEEERRKRGDSIRSFHENKKKAS
jgi:group I intron endonuclease